MPVALHYYLNTFVGDFMTLNSSTLKKMEIELPFKLTPEQKSILLLWFGADSKFGWTKLDILLGAHRVKRLYPDHRRNISNSSDGMPDDPIFHSYCDYDRRGNTIIQFHENDDEDSLPF